MAIREISDVNLVGSTGSTGAIDLLTKNTLTTAGVLVASSTALAGAAVLTVALPAQVVGAAAISGGLIYAGDRQAKGLSINPFADKSEEKESTPAQTKEAAPASEPVAEIATA